MNYKRVSLIIKHNIMAYKIRTISVIVIFTGIMILGIVPNALFNGIENYYVNGVKSLGTNTILVYTGQTENFLSINQTYGVSMSDIPSIQSHVKGIKYITPYIQIASYLPSSNVDALILSVTGEYNGIVNNTLYQGSLWNPTYNYSADGNLTRIGNANIPMFGNNETIYSTNIIPVDIGYKIMQITNSSVGSIIDAYTFAPRPLNGILMMQLKVIGIYNEINIPMAIEDLGFDLNSMIYMPITSAMEMLSTNWKAYGIIASSTVLSESNNVGNGIIQELEILHPHIPYTLLTQQQAIDTISQEVEASSVFSFVLNILSFVIGGLVIFVLTMIAVMERRKLLGILKAVGATNLSVLMLVVGEELIVAVIGIVVGIISSYVLLYSLVYISKNTPIPFYPTFSLAYFRFVDISSMGSITLTYALILFITALIGCIYPAYLAYKYSVVSSLKSE